MALVLEGLQLQLDLVNKDRPTMVAFRLVDSDDKDLRKSGSDKVKLSDATWALIQAEVTKSLQNSGKLPK